MKKILFLLTALLAMAGCTQPDDPTGGGGNNDGPGTKNGKLSVSVSELRFTASGGEQTFTVTSSDKNWSAGTYNNFLVCSTSGNTVTVTADPNTRAEERKGTVRVTAGDDCCEIPVIQEARGGGTGGGDNPAGTADGYNPYPEYDFTVCDNTLFMRDAVAQEITSLDLEHTTFYLSLNTPPEFIPQPGETYIINNRLDLFPDGALLCVQTVEQTADGYRVFYNERVGLTGAFKSLHIDEQDIDVSSSIKQILDGNGNEVSFSRTRAVNTDQWTITVPEVGWDIGKGWEMTPKITLDNTLRVQLIMDDWRISTLDVKYDVNASLGADIAISGEKDILTFHHKLLTIVCGAIPVGPILITPNIDIFAHFTAQGTISFEGSVTYKTGLVATAHYDEVSYLSGDVQKKDGDKIEYSIGPKIGGMFQYGLQFGPAIGIYGAVLEVGIGLSTSLSEELTHKLNIADPMTWGYYEGWGQALQEGEYAMSFVLGGNVFLTGMGFPLSCTLKDVKFPLESRKLIPTVSKEYRCDVNGKDITFYTWIKNKSLFYPDLFLDVGDGERYPFDLDAGKIAELENGADSVKVTAQVSIEADHIDQFNVTAIYRDVEAMLRHYRYGAMVLVDEDEQYAMEQILADIYACRGGDWDGCEWTTVSYGVANLDQIRLWSGSTEGSRHYEIIIPKEWPLGDNLYVGNHSSKVKNFSWSLDYEGDTHFSRVEIDDPYCESVFVGPDCDVFIQHTKCERPRIIYPTHVKTLDVSGSNITGFHMSTFMTDEEFKPKEVILDDCPLLETIELGRGDDSKRLTDLPHVSAKNCPKLTSVRVNRAEGNSKLFDDIEMAGGTLSLYDVTGLTDINLKTGCDHFRAISTTFNNFTATGLNTLTHVYFHMNTYQTAIFSNLPNLQDIDLARNVCEQISVTQCNAVENIQIDNYWEDPYRVGALSVTNCPRLKRLYCPCIGMSSFEASGLPVIEKLDCSSNKNLTGLMLPVFDQMFNAGYTPYYDIRYEYYWEELQKDNGYGYYYEGEPERGYHRYADDD